VNEWGKGWYVLATSIHNAVTSDIQQKYKNIDKKLQALKNSQKQKQISKTSPLSSTKIYPRIINDTNIEFSQEELTLLNKGLKYNLHFKHQNWITKLALEAETAITHLPQIQQDPIRYQVNKNI
jgi:hypothetical protein